MITKVLVQTFNTRGNINGAFLPVSQLEQGGAGRHWSSSKIQSDNLMLQVATMLGTTLTKDEVEEFMREADVDGNGKLDYDEFVKMMLMY